MRNWMLSRAQIAIGLFAVIAVGVICSLWPVQAADDDLKPDLSLNAFMRKKLEASSQILEGLTTEDSKLIQSGAKALTKLSTAEKWQILTDPEYREQSAEFRMNVKRLNLAAEKNNFDNAALQWIDTMKCCIECHKYVRSEQRTKK